MLLVEDEPVLSRVLAHILTDAGYEVTSCHDGLDALNLVMSRVTAIDLVVSDVGLPGLRGDRLAAELRKIRPELPVVLMTGFSTAVTLANAATLGVSSVLEKPIEIEDLLAAVADALRVGEGENEHFALRT